MVLMEAFIHQTKGLVLILVKQTQNFASVFIIMIIIVIYSLTEKKSNLKSIKNVNFIIQFCLGSTSNGFGATEFRESLKGNVYDFSVDYNAGDKFDMLNINRY